MLKILYEETDGESGLSLPEIQAKLEDYGITSERKALYRDFAALDQMGIKIGKLPTRPVTYYLEERIFDTTQLMLLIDAVQTSKSITKSNSMMLIRKLKKLASKQTARRLDTRVHVAGRVKMQNESIFNTLDLIQKAISEKRDISFSYMQYGVDGKLHVVESADGKTRIKTPLHIIYSNDSYYLLVYDDHKEDHLRIYRIDRMHNVLLMDKSDKSHVLGRGFSISDYESKTIGMFDGKEVAIVLQAAEEVIGNVMDIFGPSACSLTPAKDIPELDDVGIPERKWANIHVKTVPNPVLFGLLAQFGGDVRVKSPKAVREAYVEHLKRTLESQEL